MTYGGWVFMIVSWAVIVWVNVICFREILTRKKH
jgi:hypothetical protein